MILQSLNRSFSRSGLNRSVINVHRYLDSDQLTKVNLARGLSGKKQRKKASYFNNSSVRRSFGPLSPGTKSKETIEHEMKLEPGYELKNRRYVLGLNMGEMKLESFNNIISEDPYKQKMEVIERAWAVSKIKEMAGTRLRLVEYYRSIRRAMEELEKVSSRLFREASRHPAIGEEAFLYNKMIRPPTHPPMDDIAK